MAVQAPLFNLRLTIESGQVFHWTEDSGVWSGLIGKTPVRVVQANEKLAVTPGAEKLVSDYFALDHPLERIYETFPSDPYTRAAMKSCRGIRIVRQPRWECVATFITSSMKQFRHIRQMSLAIRKQFGRAVDGSAVEAYPDAGAVACATEQQLRACGLGFRAPNLLKTARMIDDGQVDLDAVSRMETLRAREELCKLPGVGAKVASCVLLFAYERLEAVPIDVWIKRVLSAMSGRASASQIEAFSRERLGPYAGYVQQCLFHHARASKTLPPGP